MFYAQDLLSRKNALGKVWLAAHVNPRLSRNQVLAVDLSKAVGDIVNPKQPLALRLSGHLLLGVVRYYSRKVYFLFTECNDAMSKLKMAVRPATVDLPQGAATSNVNVANFGQFGDDNLDDSALMEMGVFTFDVDEFMELATGSQLPATPSGSGMRRSASSSDLTPGSVELPRAAGGTPRSRARDSLLPDADTGTQGDDPFRGELSEPPGDLDLTVEPAPGDDFDGAGMDFQDDFGVPAMDVGDNEIAIRGDAALETPGVERTASEEALRRLREAEDVEGSEREQQQPRRRPRKRARAIPVDESTTLDKAEMHRLIKDPAPLVRTSKRQRRRMGGEAGAAAGARAAAGAAAPALAPGLADSVAAELATLMRQGLDVGGLPYPAAHAAAHAGAAAAADDDFDGAGMDFQDDVEVPRGEQSAAGASAVDDLQPPSSPQAAGPDGRPGMQEEEEEEEMGGFDVSGGEAFSFTDGEPLSPIAAGNISVAETAGRSPAEGGRLHRNTAKVLQYLDRAIEAAEGDSVSFQRSLGRGVNRANASRAFLQLLVLKTRRALDVKQDEPFGHIHVSRGDNFQHLRTMATHA